METVNGQDLRNQFEADMKAIADQEKIYVNFDRRTNGEYKEVAIRLSYKAFLAGVTFIVDGAMARI